MKKIIIMLALLANPVFAGDFEDVVKLYGQFLRSTAAAEQCAKVDKAAQSQFFKNFEKVFAFFYKEALTKFPGTTKEELSKTTKQLQDDANKQISDWLKIGGCDNKNVQEHVKSFFEFARADLFDK